LGNVYHIDTGGWLTTGRFTLLDLASLKVVSEPQDLLVLQTS
jgi:hypothetical protein